MLTTSGARWARSVTRIGDISPVSCGHQHSPACRGFQVTGLVADGDTLTALRLRAYLEEA